MAESFEARLRTLNAEREKAADARDKFYPGSPEWENANGLVVQWDRAILDLRDEQAEAS